MKKRIIIEDNTIKVEGTNEYRTAEVITDLILAMVKIAKATGLSKRGMFKAIKKAWKHTQIKNGD